jgi:hypothetical protein
MDPTDQVRADNRAIGQQRSPVLAAAIEDGNLVIIPDDHQVNFSDQAIGRDPIWQGTPGGDINLSDILGFYSGHEIAPFPLR